MLRKVICGVAVTLLFVAAAVDSRADTINVAGVITVAGATYDGGGNLISTGSAGIAPGASDNYAFFGAGHNSTQVGSQPTHLTNFTESTIPPIEYGGGGITPPGYSYVRAPGGGTPFETGIAYASQPPDSRASLVTFTLNSGSNLSFSMFVLIGNTDGNGIYDQSIDVTINAQTPVTYSFTDTQKTNNFVEFDITGANANDTFKVSATSTLADAFDNTSNVQPYIGGVTFSDGPYSATPEPSSLALLGIGAAALVGWRRWRKRA